jgi:SAM-dependent methyltransferase
MRRTERRWSTHIRSTTTLTTNQARVASHRATCANGTASYRAVWDALASSVSGARHFCDGSANERELRQRGAELAGRIGAAIDIRPHHSVLELGCGVARLGLPMAERCAAWSGCDISPKMLAIARRRMRGMPNIDLSLLRDISLAAYKSRSYDRAYSIGVFCHLRKEDVFRYLCDVHRVLKPGGVFSCGMWNLCSDGGWRLWLEHIREQSDVPLHTWTTPQEFEALLSGAGFTIQALLTSSHYLVEAVVSRGATRARLLPTALLDDDGIFTSRRSDEHV